MNKSMTRSRMRTSMSYKGMLAGNSPFGVTTVQGGTLSSDSTYYYNTFRYSGSLVIANGSIPADILVVAGGASGGSDQANAAGGGGGAGGLRVLASQTLSSGTYTITVGAGGARKSNYGAGNTGTNSSFNTISVTGGGGGAVTADASWNPVNGQPGGSGGGGAQGRTGGAGNSGAYSPVEGYAGGGSTTTNTASGGGGASAAGGTGSNPNGGAGGAGASVYNSIDFSSWLTATGTGASGKLAGGGGGAGSIAGPGGAGGGGNGGVNGGTTAQDAIANTGGGGGGCNNDKIGGGGGSGLVIVRYPKSAVQVPQDNYELIGNVTLSAAQSSVTFTGLPSGYKHLQLRIITKSTAAVSEDNFKMQFNTDSGNNYVTHNLYGTGAAMNANWPGSTQSYTQPGSTLGASAAASVFSVHVIDILDAFSSTKNKTIRTIAGFTDAAISRTFLSSGLWLSTSAISSITFSTNANIAANSRFLIYGVRG